MSRLFITFVIVILSINAYSQNERTAQDLNERGIERQASGDYQDAIAYFTQAIELTSRLSKNERAENLNIRAIDPRTAVSYINRANVYLAKYELDSALEDFNRAVAISPIQVEAYMGRGTLWLLKKDPDNIIAIILDHIAKENNIVSK